MLDLFVQRCYNLSLLEGFFQDWLEQFLLDLFRNVTSLCSYVLHMYVYVVIFSG